MATDSAPQWDLMMGKLLPSVPYRVLGVRRAEALRMLRTVHIAPSHRRDPHHIWKDALRLILDLLLGHGKDRYLGRLKLRQQRTRCKCEATLQEASWSCHSELSSRKCHVSRAPAYWEQLLARQNSCTESQTMSIKSI